MFVFFRSLIANLPPSSLFSGLIALNLLILSPLSLTHLQYSPWGETRHMPYYRLSQLVCHWTVVVIFILPWKHLHEGWSLESEFVCYNVLYITCLDDTLPFRYDGAYTLLYHILLGLTWLVFIYIICAFGYFKYYSCGMWMNRGVKPGRTLGSSRKICEQ